MHANSKRFALLFFLFLSTSWSVSAQTQIWTDTFQQGQAPTFEQCQRWTSFLDQLAGKSFVSVTISGTFDETGKTINDPVAATQLAAMMASRTLGTVQSGSDYWTLTDCFASACGSASVALSVNGSSSQCDCNDTYAIRPHVSTADWGGVNVAYSCGAASQTMTVRFNSGVSISASGPTTLCEGGSVVLTANTDICLPPLSYLWNNGATTSSITVTEPGNYNVTVTGAGGCTGTSETIVVTATDISVNAGSDAMYCNQPVQLNAAGTSNAGSGAVNTNNVCIYNSPGGIVEDCEFTSDLCTEGATFVGNSSYAATVSFSNPTELRYHMFYSAFAASTFRFKLNNQELGSVVETNTTGACDTRESGQFPRSFIFNEGQFKQYWIDGGDNELRIEIEAPDNGVYLAGITAEVVTSNETYSWSPLAGLSNASIKNPLASPLVTTVYTVTYTDANGCTAIDDVTVTVNCDLPPLAICQELTIAAGNNCEAIVSASAFDGGSTGAPGTTLSFTVSPAGPYALGETQVLLTVTDSNGASSTCTTKIVVTNEAPTITTVTATPSLVSTNTPVVLTTTYIDNNASSATIDWGDLSSPEIVASPAATFDASHSYSAPGTYAVSVTITDYCNASATFTYESIVVSRRRSGFVRGGGWFESPPGAYRENVRASGKANFLFDARFTSGSDVPLGSAVFNFSAAKLKFKTSELQWLMIDGQAAVLKGRGSLNNNPGYEIIIGMLDLPKDRLNKKSTKKPDRIRVKISDPLGVVIYDTQPGEPDQAAAAINIGGGDIVINDLESSFATSAEEVFTSYFADESTSVYPNPFTDFLNVQFNSDSNEKVLVQLMDLTGKVIASGLFPVSNDGYYSLDVPAKAMAGIYILTLKQGERFEVLRLVRN